MSLQNIVRNDVPFAEAFKRDGVVLLKDVLDADALMRAEEAFNWSIAHPSPAVQYYYPEEGAKFFQDSYNVESWPVYRRFIEAS